MTNLTEFDFNTQQVRVITVDEQPWFVAKDVCIILSIANVSDALSRLDEDEKNTIVLTDGNRGNPTTSIVSESGMLALVLSSRKPEAKAFRKWVTSVVLPAIFRTGSYSTAPTLPIDSPIPTQAIDLCKSLFLEAGIEVPLASSWVLSQYAKYDATNGPVYEDGKKLLASVAEVPSRLLTPTEIGLLLAERDGREKPLSAIAVNQLLADQGFQVQLLNGKKKTWHLTDLGKQYGKIVMDSTKGRDKTVTHVRWFDEIVDQLAA